MIFSCLGKQNKIFFHLRNQAKGLIFTWENKITFSFAWDSCKAREFYLAICSAI